jgi:hypothetical protein
MDYKEKLEALKLGLENYLNDKKGSNKYACKVALELNIPNPLIIWVYEYANTLSQSGAYSFLEEFLSSINLNSDLSLVAPKFLLKLLCRSFLFLKTSDLGSTHMLIEFLEQDLKKEEKGVFKIREFHIACVSHSLADLAANSFDCDYANNDYQLAFNDFKGDINAYYTDRSETAKEQEYTNQKNDLLQILRETK